MSTKSKEQVSSIENQTKYYTEKIAKTPNWDLAEIYSDEGKSGTSKKWRPEFKRMLEDASKKKMDLIVCASVSRFARNISDLIEEVRKLRTTNPSNPVGVYFETEDLYTLDPNINERLQMQGLFAEWESGNKSRRMILSYDQRICTGQFPLSDLLGLRHTIEGGFIIEEEEAKTVKYIFLATLCGYTAEEIAEVLTEKQRPTLRGRTEWTPSMVKAIMENERRWGDLEVRKRVVIDYKEKVTAKNDGLREGAYIPHYHEGIVSPEIARAAHMLSENKKRMVVAICAEEEISSIEWARLKKDKWVNRSISCPEYVQSIYKMMNWNKECRYKIYGRLANSERGLVLVFDLASAVMFDPLPEEYFDKHTGKMKKRIVKYYPDEIRMKLGRSYSDYEALQQRSSFESLSGYMDTSGGAVPATVSEDLAASISMQEQEKKRETLFGTIIGNGGDDDVRNNE